MGALRVMPYSHGFQGWGAHPGYGELVIALIGPDGTQIAHEATPRTDGGRFSCPPDRQPSPRGFFLQPDLHRFVVRLDAKPDFAVRDERWLLYSLADGKRAGELTATAPPSSEKLWYMAVDADALPNTELSLVLWSRCDWRPNGASDEGVRLVLIDKEAKEIWSREWTTEFNGIKYFSPWELRETDVTPSSRFSNDRFVYLSRSQQAALTFVVSKNADGMWKVDEVG